MSVEAVEGRQRAGGVKDWMIGRLTAIAPLITLIFLVVVFSLMSPSFLTVDNFANVLRQVSITAIMAVGLTFVILTAEIDLSVASVANATGIVVAFFTMQEAYVNIANVPLFAHAPPRASAAKPSICRVSARISANACCASDAVQ